jgi:putative transposase
MDIRSGVRGSAQPRSAATRCCADLSPLVATIATPLAAPVIAAVRLRGAASTIWQILHDAGTGPAPRRTEPTWKQFLTLQARGILAADFVHAGTILLRRSYALILIEHGIRRAHLAGITTHPDGARATLAVRNFLMDIGHHADSPRFLIP